MSIRPNKGFTLIELLVVIAIIGILSAIILVFLSLARSKAYDARVKSEMRQITTAAALYYANNGVYDMDGNFSASSCGVNNPVRVVLGEVFADPSIERMIDDLTGPGGFYPKCWNSYDNYMIITPLETEKDKAWCVDSQNNSMLVKSPYLFSSQSAIGPNAGFNCQSATLQ